MKDSNLHSSLMDCSRKHLIQLCYCWWKQRTCHCTNSFVFQFFLPSHFGWCSFCWRWTHFSFCAVEFAFWRFCCNLLQVPSSRPCPSHFCRGRFSRRKSSKINYDGSSSKMKENLRKLVKIWESLKFWIFFWTFNKILNLIPYSHSNFDELDSMQIFSRSNRRSV